MFREKDTFKYSIEDFFMNTIKGQLSPIFTNALMFWIVKIVIIVIIYFWLIAPYLKDSDPAVANFINIAYAFLALFIIFGMKIMKVAGMFHFGK